MDLRLVREAPLDEPGGVNKKTETVPVRVFVSYAWENDEYRELVKRLAVRLRDDGVDARLDVWHSEGLTIPEFMEREVRQADKSSLCAPLSIAEKFTTCRTVNVTPALAGKRCW
jgi:hypothetical protein